MSTPISSYSFLPWARQGLGIFLREADQDTAVKARASIDVRLQINGEQLNGGTATATVPRAVQLYGPGDIIGIDLKAIVRTEPRHYITNFESNYLPLVEFYDEDFPWRYTPARPSSNQLRLRPWLALVVLEESEFNEGNNRLGRPLPYIEVAQAAQKFPPADQLWAWAHVHVNGGMTGDPNDTTSLAAQLDATVRANRDLAYSRLLCPRILKPNTAYHAFLIPSFETGRLAGLGKDPDTAQFATQSAWESYSGRVEGDFFPVYHRWYFRTGTVGDFEYLVRLLQPRTVDPRVGRRDMDVQSPGASLPGIPELGGILRLGGALRPPLATLSEEDLQEYQRHEQWGKPYPHAFQVALAALINLARDYTDKSAEQANAGSGLGPEVETDEDPLVVPPLYGRWHAETQRLVAEEGDPAKAKWVQELNLDPRHRTAAGFGTAVVQENQENYMEAAWQQVGRVLEANQKIRFAHMAQFTSQVWHARELTAINQSTPERFVALVTPVQRRVVAQGFTLHHHVQQSTLAVTLLSKAMRQALRPRGRVAQLVGFDAGRHRGNLLARANRGEVSAAPPKVVAPALPTGEKVAEDLGPRELPEKWLALLLRRPWLRFAPLALALLIFLVLLLVNKAVASIIGAALFAGAIWLTRWLNGILQRGRAAEALNPETRTPASVDQLPASPDFRIGVPGQDPPPNTNGRDSAEAVRFKGALRNLYTVDVAERELPVRVRQPLDLPGLASSMLENLQPMVTIPRRTLATLVIPPRLRGQLVESFGEVMAYPEIDQPMYEPLKNISSEMFLPNLQLIQNNTITLLETNQKFIESYMVGLNHEFARELLWREYPTDQRGSYFRQFWDVRGFLAEAAADPEALRERLRDIPELHRWSRNSALGDHDHREAQGDKEEELVLVIRGELLKKYPTAVIYAHRAAFERTSDGKIDKTRPRRLMPLTPAQEANPPRDIVKTPLYEARIDPDIYFFGFDLTAEKARGGQIVNGEEDAGWFFVIKERPGEPRFGLDLPQAAPQATIHTWNDLAWTDVLNDFANSRFLRLGEKSITLTDPGSGSEARPQYQEDSRFRWHADTHAAEVAYILYQVPVLVAVHAAEMLKQSS
ncbi:MAG: hypothetical protein ONB48_11855 [candidate division KSB1 bacterium]|nr:hypothetical protein [candidate division KSB1 bacterium]MDZ7273965.1 hypothetical protein [candidate division KSB1 bacterium]MDZ7286338.1 hypothetical protein [candidate division KSB1 bacterium]MDZ7296566.1 hypothetical protein [candidate division KSB1 bacterium]MDZ7306099.1 hypothetical protein [candidate division KSB1 bacterium]